MPSVELLKQNLAIEPDLQNFIGFALSAVKTLRGNAFSATLGMLDVLDKLRLAGAGTGYPLPAQLVLIDKQLCVNWGDDGQMLLVELELPPAVDEVEKLLRHLRQSTESEDPALLLRRNEEMTRFLNETRERTEHELEDMQQTLARRQEELRESVRKAETDALTGLLNRRAYDERLAQAFHRTLRQPHEILSLILFDLDYFKQINDESGHQFGDAYLNKMAQAMLEAIRQDVDLAFRFGGDEFATLIFADTNIACKHALQVLASMTNKVSIGIATISADKPCDGGLEKFIHRADDALYQAKRAGRGRVVVSTCDADGKVSYQYLLPGTTAW
ncbi:MAG: GGDEF domain-containing protein [Betaproteobacteria bacterium]|nr:GGDEF domain-containing protein [Betaproteobacteria bacterium]